MKRIGIALSGGIDSAVAGFLLKEKKYPLVGFFMKIWKDSPEREERAKRVAQILNIPFYVINLEKEFKEMVVDYLLKRYSEGITPNPCVICNKEIKFNLFLMKALEKKIEFLATGHYAKRVKDKKRKIFKLMRPKDKKRDQSYFLWTLTQSQLEKILFPLGNLKKERIKEIAKKTKLSFLAKFKTSTDLCFIKGNFEGFLKENLKGESGLMVEETKEENKKEKILKIGKRKFKILGKHQGLAFYTIGQRRGLFLSGGPYYVKEKDLKHNLLIVTKDEKEIYKKELFFTNFNWISGKAPTFPKTVKAKIRYLHRMATAKIFKIRGSLYKLIFKKPQRAITPGQSVVFYQKDEVLGGGIIVK